MPVLFVVYIHQIFNGREGGREGFFSLPKMGNKVLLCFDWVCLIFRKHI